MEPWEAVGREAERTWSVQLEERNLKGDLMLCL